MAARHLLSMASRVPTPQFRRGGVQWRRGGLADGGSDSWRKFGLQLAQTAECRVPSPESLSVRGCALPGMGFGKLHGRTDIFKKVASARQNVPGSYPPWKPPHNFYKNAE